MSRSVWRVVIALACTVAVAGCGGTAARRGDGTAPSIVDLTDPTQPIPIEQFLKPDATIIQPGDHLEIRVLGYTDYSGVFWVSPAGRIDLLLVGSVQASGKTAQELDRELTAAYATYLRNIDLAVNVLEYHRRLVYVLGEVSRPGSYDFQTGDRVLHAVAMGGGMLQTARENDIVLMRRTPDGTDHAYRLDFSTMHLVQSPLDIYLQPGDVVFVPKGRFRTATEFTGALLDVLGRTVSTAVVSQDLLGIRNRAIAISR